MQQVSVQPTPVIGPVGAERRVVAHSFLWMLAALLLSTASAFVANGSGAVQYLTIDNELFGIALFVIWIFLSLAFQPLARRVPLWVSLPLFAVYALLTGVSLSVLVAQYTTASVVQAFIATVVLFGLMAAFGMFTRMNLMGGRFYLIAGGIALAVVGLLNWFVWQSAWLDWVISLATVGIFAYSTARTVQQIEALARTTEPARHSRIAIIGAMLLFTNIVVLFTRMLRTTGNKR